MPPESIARVEERTLYLAGDWRLPGLAALDRQLRELDAAHCTAVDARDIEHLDASGAAVLLDGLDRLGLAGLEPDLAERFVPLFAAITDARQRTRRAPGSTMPGWRALLDRTGRAAVEIGRNLIALTGFLGLVLHRLARSLLHPSRLRLTATVHHMEQTGFDAVPLLALLSALVGAVVAYLGATVLSDFGAELLVIDLVTFAFLREFGVLLTAILLAGRTASAFCAQIGMMKTREEIDAIRTLGLDEIELLVLPRLLALLVMLPLLAFVAMASGLVGGFVVSVLALDLSPDLFIERVGQTLELHHYLVGLVKAPLFALVIALIGCNEGLRVAGTAQSVGEHTTSAVVQSITLVIVIDALAAIYFMEIGW